VSAECRKPGLWRRVDDTVAKRGGHKPSLWITFGWTGLATWTARTPPEFQRESGGEGA
jgi:hypothetical protein